ncbi:hypothetical protein XNW1_3370004 [Xenorhabdus nematophila str. Websteri]|nr:hypothetical protein XNW1_3370004 [Xenorhabdus nematophila str. Websteri]
MEEMIKSYLEHHIEPNPNDNFRKFIQSSVTGRRNIQYQ